MLPFGVGGDAVHGVELARLAAAFAEAGHDFERIALDDVDPVVHAVGQIHILLLRILGEGDVPHRAVAQRILRDEGFLDERAVRLEDLNAVVHAVADIQQADRRRARRSGPDCGTAGRAEHPDCRGRGSRRRACGRRRPSGACTCRCRRRTRSRDGCRSRRRRRLHWSCLSTKILAGSRRFSMSLLPLLWPGLPICIRNFPSCVNFRIMLS